MSPRSPSPESFLSVTSFLCDLLALFQAQRTHLQRNIRSMNMLLHWSHAHAQLTFPLRTGSCLGRTRHVPPTAHLQAALLGLIHHLGALLQNAAVQLPEVGHVGLHDIPTLLPYPLQPPSESHLVKTSTKPVLHATSESALWTAGPKWPVRPQPPADTAPGQPGRVSHSKHWLFHLQDANTTWECRHLFGGNRASQTTKPFSQLKYTEVQKEVTLTVNMHLFPTQKLLYL